MTATNFNQDRFLRAKEIRSHFSISDPTLHRWIRAGKIPIPEYLNSQRVWRESSIQAAEEKLLSSECSTANQIGGKK